MLFYQFIILSKQDIELSNLDYCQIKKAIVLVDENTLILNDQKINFNYLLFDDAMLISNLKDTKILTDRAIIVTNFFHATSVENIFYTKMIPSTIKAILNDEIL